MDTQQFSSGVFYRYASLNLKQLQVNLGLIENIKNTAVSRDEQRAQLDLLSKLNEVHRKQRPHDMQLEARIQSYELAYRMQMEADDAFEVVRVNAAFEAAGIRVRSMRTKSNRLEELFVRMTAREGVA